MKDLDKLIDRITDEVIRKLSTTSSESSHLVRPQKTITRAELASRIDHTLLKPDVTREQIEKLCREALQYGFAAVCVNPVWVRPVAAMLKGSSVRTCAVIGFPLGTGLTDSKSYEARRVILDGAQEVDMVINIGALKGGDDELVERDIQAVVQVAKEYGAIVKVILETCLLSQEEIVRGCQLSMKAGAHFVKTSTGFGSGGATVEIVRLMKDTVGDRVQVKASGGIKTFNDAITMLEAGASRIGTSGGVAMVKNDSAAQS